MPSRTVPVGSPPPQMKPMISAYTEVSLPALTAVDGFRRRCEQGTPSQFATTDMAHE